MRDRTGYAIIISTLSLYSAVAVGALIGNSNAKVRTVTNRVTVTATATSTATPTVAETVTPSAKPSPTQKALARVKPSSSPRPKATRTSEPEPEAAYYSNCTELRKDFPNGVRSIHPAYRSALDRDDDGRACER